MRALTKIIFTLLSLVPLLALFGDASHAQGVKIGFINDEQIKESYPEWVRAQEQMEIEMKAWDDEATTKQAELEELVTEYEKQKLILSDEKKREREAAIRAKKEGLDAYTRQVYGPGGTAERKQMDLISPLLERVNNAIQLVAEENGFDVIFTLQSGLGYIKPTLDVTDKVLNKLEKLE
ncbi:MAG: OmpH family outer membrane protein [candidate division Zixibacteria bacterium]|nr:OmpH family outer membrane protein [candidate division Zixibacteria bacterium]